MESRDGIFGGTITLMVHDTDTIKRVCEGLRANPSITEVTRI